MAKEYPYGDGIVKWTSTDWLAEHLGDDNFMIMDVQPDIHDYIFEHIPGAVYFNQKLLRVPEKGRPGAYIPGDIAGKLFGRIGLKPDFPVVVYTGVGQFRGWGDGLEQTMVTYCLARYGHNKVYVLDGGIDKWRKEGKPVTKEFPDVEESNFNAKVRNEYWVNMEEVKKMKDRDDVALLDARPASAYEGQGPWVKPGHIPGAINVPWKMFMTEDNSRLLKPEEEIKEVLNKHELNPDKTIICSCGTSREATNEFLLFKWYLGYPKVKIYEGSFTEWSSYPENPTVTGKEPG